MCEFIGCAEDKLDKNCASEAKFEAGKLGMACCPSATGSFKHELDHKTITQNDHVLGVNRKIADE